MYLFFMPDCQINNNKITNHILFAFDSFLIGILFRLDVHTGTQIIVGYFESYTHMQRVKRENMFDDVCVVFIRNFLLAHAGAHWPQQRMFVEIEQFLFFSCITVAAAGKIVIKCTKMKEIS